MLKIKGVLYYSQKARKSHLKTFTLTRSAATKSPMIEKVLVCTLFQEKVKVWALIYLATKLMICYTVT